MKTSPRAQADRPHRAERSGRPTIKRIPSGLRRTEPPLIVGVAGGTASGKTMVVNGVLARLGAENVLLIAHDSYYRDRSHLSPDERARVNYDHPEALETAALIEHLRRLRAGQGVDIPVYDFATHTRRAENRRVGPRKVIIVEGLHVLTDPGLRKQLDLKVYVDADADVRLIRRLERDISERGRTLGSVVRQYLESARPMHSEYVEPSRRFADVILPNTKAGDAAIGRLAELIRDRLKTKTGRARGGPGPARG